MPRPRKCRRICGMPKTKGFNPENDFGERPVVLMTVDEYETIRLIDKEGLTQEECSVRMDVARTTVQQIYTSARKKLADALVDALPLRILGGDYRICEEDKITKQCPFCKQTHRNCKHKRNDKMKIAIPLDENKTDICITFGRAPFFMFYDIDTKETNILENPAVEAQGGAGVKAAQFIIDNGATVLLTIRCGENSNALFKAADTKIYKAENGTAQSNIDLYLQEKLPILTHFHAGYHGLV